MWKRCGWCHEDGCCFFFQAEDGIRDTSVTGVQTCALPISYVALSRHRQSVELHYGRDDFADQRRLGRVLSRERAKDMASDYERDIGRDIVPERPDRKSVV